jgi:hypothetical protein
MHELGDVDDNAVEFVEVGNDDVEITEAGNQQETVEVMKAGNRQETVEITEAESRQQTAKIPEDDVVEVAGKLLKGKEKAIEVQGEPMIEESAASFHSFLLRPGIEELIKELHLESGRGEMPRGVELRTTVKERKAHLLSRLLEAELYLAAGIDQLHDCLKTFVAGSSNI